MKEKIRVITQIQSLRLRPEMYLSQPKATGFGILKGIIQTLSDTEHNSEKEIPESLHVQLLSDGAYCLTCDSPMLPTGTVEYLGVKQPAVIPLLLCLHVPGWGFLGFLPIMSALSEYLKIVSTEEGVSTCVETSRGGLVSPVSSQKSTKASGTILEYLPDYSLLEVQDLSPEEILERASRFPLRIPFNLTCERVERTEKSE